MRINIKTDFSRTPGPRYIDEGEFSGELFRTKVLLPSLREALEKNEPLEVVLDGTAGYGTSFLEESFGGLIREDKLKLNDIKRILKLISKEEPNLIEEINEDLEEAEAKSTSCKG